MSKEEIDKNLDLINNNFLNKKKIMDRVSEGFLYLRKLNVKKHAFQSSNALDIIISQNLIFKTNTQLLKLEKMDIASPKNFRNQLQSISSAKRNSVCNQNISNETTLILNSGHLNRRFSIPKSKSNTFIHLDKFTKKINREKQLNPVIQLVSFEDDSSGKQ